MVIARGQVWWADLGETRGSGPGHRRPVVVVQNDSFNASLIRTVAASLTTNVRLASMPGNVLIPEPTAGLGEDSVVNVTQISTVDRGDLLDRVGAIDSWLTGEVDEGVRGVLGL